MFNLDDIIKKLKEQIEHDNLNSVTYKNKKSKEVTQLIDLLSDIDQLVNGNKEKVLDFISQVLSKIFDEETYLSYMKDLKDLVDKYNKFINYENIKNAYEEFLNNLCNKLYDEKLKIEKEAEEEHHLKFSTSKYVILLNKIENNELLNEEDIELIIKLYNEEDFNIKVNVLNVINEYNKSFYVSKTQEKTTSSIINNTSVKNLFDSRFVDVNGNIICDKNGNTVYDALPDKYKTSLIKQYSKNSDIFVQILDIIFLNKEFEFMRTYGTSFHDPIKLKKEQTELCKLLRNANYFILNKKLKDLCNKYGFTMEEVITKVSGVYKNVKDQQSEGKYNGSQIKPDELIISGCYEYCEDNLIFLESLNSSLPKKIMETCPEILGTEHELFKKNVNYALQILNLSLDELILYAEHLIPSTLLDDNVKILEEYGFDINSKNKSVFMPLLGIHNLKSRISSFIESDMFTYLKGDILNNKKGNPGRLIRGLDFLKKFYYGNSNRANGLIEMETNPSRLSINSKGVKGKFDKYNPAIERKHYDDIDSFTNSYLFKKIKNKIPQYINEYIDNNIEKHIDICKDKGSSQLPRLNLDDEVGSIIDYLDNASYKKLDPISKENVEIPFYVDEYTYNFDGILISRHKFIDMIYLFQKCYYDMYDKLDNKEISADERGKIKESFDFITSTNNLGLYIIYALTYSSNCSHYALLKIIKAIFKDSSFVQNFEDSFKNILYKEQDEIKNEEKEDENQAKTTSL